MNNLECPYCSKDVDPDEDFKEQEEDYEIECPHCGKNFIYRIEYYPTYFERQAPCLNGKKHKFEKIIGYPLGYYRNKKRCIYCSKEIG